jgi:hypothetical protein
MKSREGWMSEVRGLVFIAELQRMDDAQIMATAFIFLHHRLFLSQRAVRGVWRYRTWG